MYEMTDMGWSVHGQGRKRRNDLNGIGGVVSHQGHHVRASEESIGPGMGFFLSCDQWSELP
jgi:hypothetical protein